MIQGLLTEQTPVTTPRDREAQSYLHLFNQAHDVEQYLAVKAFRIRLLGDFVLLANDRPITYLDVPRLQSLLAYLVLHRGLPQSRSRIAYTLWPDSTDAQAHTNLRNLLFKLRLTLPGVETFLAADRQTLCWHTDALWSLDVQDFEGAIAQAEQARCRQDSAAERQALEQAFHCYQGNLLPDCYDEWILEERDRLRQLYQGVLERLSELLEHAGNYAEAIRVAQHLLRLNPLQETTYCHLMRLHAARGDRGTVMRTYQTCATVLQRELAIEPAVTTRKTYQRLMRAEN